MADRQAKRLWLRTPDGRWTVPPVGANEDSTVRSLNIHDGFEWRTITPYHYNVHAMGQEDNGTFLTRAPGTVWTDQEFNPNLEEGQEHSVPAPGWVRLFYVGYRVDPTWRVVDLGFQYPFRPPSLPPIGPGTSGLGDDSYTSFTGSGRQYYTSPNPVFETQLSSTYNVPSMLTLATEIRGADTFFTQRRKFSSVTVATLIDCKSIKAYLSQRWPSTNYGAGQYHPLSTMTEKRVVVRGTVYVRMYHQKPELQFEGFLAPEQPGWFEALTVQIYAKGSAGTQSDPNGYPPTARYPVSAGLEGQPVFTLNGLPGPSVASYSGSFWQREVTIPVYFIFDGDITDNISFSTNIGPIPDVLSVDWYGTELEGKYPSEVYATAQFQPQQTFIHYATAGHDTPYPMYTPPDDTPPTFITLT